MHPDKPDHLKLFGLDLRSLWRELWLPWRRAFEWPVLAWLTPEQVVRLAHDNGEQSFWRLGTGARKLAAREAGTARAIELPEDMVLRRTLHLPAVAASDIDSAVALEMQRLSPFPAGDLVWGHRTSPPQAGVLRVQAAQASRRQVEALLRERGSSEVDASSPEAWVLAEGGQPIVLRGFGEAARLRRMAAWRRASVCLLALAAMLLMAIAITPTLQLRQRALEAVEASATLHRRAEPTMRQREELVRVADQLKGLRELTADRVDPLVVLDLLTQALPDDTVLQNLQVQGGKVLMSGQTGNSASLMQLLSSRPGLKDVNAPSPATRPLGAPKESFVIEFQLETRTADTAAASPASAPASAASAPVAPASSASAPVAAGASASTAAGAAQPQGMDAFTTGGRSKPVSTPAKGTP